MQILHDVANNVNEEQVLFKFFEIGNDKDF